MKDVQAINEVCEELQEAMAKHAPMNSAHEGWAVIMEEVDELWDEVKLRPSKRNKDALRLEAKQIAAMAIRFMIEVAS